MTKSTAKQEGRFGFYGRSLLFFLVVGLILLGAVVVWKSFSLQANDPPILTDPRLTDGQTLLYNLLPDGSMVLGKSRQSPEVFTTESTYRYRLQVLSQPDEYVSEFTVAVILPQPGGEDTIAHRFINNGGALLAVSELVDRQAILYQATDISSEAQL